MKTTRLPDNDALKANDPGERAVAIADYLQMVLEPGQVVEIRALKVQPRYGSRCTYAGYYCADRESLVNAGHDVLALPQAAGVYFTLNPVNPAVLARRGNRLERAAANELTKDKDITARRFLMIDVDPVRPSSISGTATEKQAALSKLLVVRDQLRSLGWPDPIVMDSGNGGHLLYRIALPVDDGGLVRKVQEAIANQFDDEHVKIDRGVHNPGRLSKLPFTWARKGDDLPDRPHRLAYPIEIPVDAAGNNRLEPVAVELLESFVAQTRAEMTASPSANPSAANGNGTCKSFLLMEDWLTDSGVEFRAMPNDNGGTKYLLKECPFDSSHTDTTAFFTSAGGRPGFKCFHNSCSGYHWKEASKRLGKPQAHHYDPPLRGRAKNGDLPPDDGPMPSDAILVTPAEHEVISQVTAQLAQRDQDLYQRGGELVRVTQEARPEAEDERVRQSSGPRVEALPAPDLRTRITRHCTLMAERKSGRVRVSPPAWLPNGIMAESVRWDGIRPLESVTETPLLRANGTILQEPGYDPATGILYVPSMPFDPIPNTLTREDALQARDALLEVVCDFPFAAAMHQSSWLTSALTPLARPAFSGPSPLFLTDANTRGSGKGLSASCAALIATGRQFAVAMYSHDSIEMNKTITAIAHAAVPVIMLDNLSGVIGNASLDAALTTTEWQGRILGTTQQPRVPLLCTWYATGNNCMIAADTARRVCHIRFESPEERPEERADFRHSDLLAYVTANRPRLLRAALVILAAYCQAGRPIAQLRSWGSFEGWSALVRQAIVWIGMPDPADTRLALAEEADQDVALLRALMLVWDAVAPAGEPATAKSVLERLEGQKATHAAQFEALITLCPDKSGGLPRPHRLGNLLRKFKGRVCDGRRFDSQSSRGGVLQWRLVQPGIGCTGGTGWTVPRGSETVQDSLAGEKSQECMISEPRERVQPVQPVQPNPPPSHPQALDQDDEEWVQERAGLLQFDAGLTREEAERQARAEFAARKSAQDRDGRN